MQTIDLISFLKNYYGIVHESLSIKKLSHEDVMKLFPYVKECDMESVTIEDISRGNIIGVYDKYKRVIYYYNPHLEINSEMTKEKEDKENDDTIYFTIEDLENLSKEELLALRRKLRLNNQRKESYMINGLIKKIKRKEPRDYRKKKEKLLIKERMKDYD